MPSLISNGAGSSVWMLASAADRSDIKLLWTLTDASFVQVLLTTPRLQSQIKSSSTAAKQPVYMSAALEALVLHQSTQLL